jgi:glycosyltransferase involved in cell wall biosynthesis
MKAEAKARVAIIGTNGIPARYGGFETLAEYLAKYLHADFDLFVYCAKTPKSKRLKSFNNASLIYLPFKANGWQSMVYDALSILHGFVIADVLVILGFSGVFAFPLRVLFRKKIVFNIGGIEWKKVRGTKTLGPVEIAAKKWFERICVHFSDLIVVDNQVLSDYVRKVYGIPSMLVEYGGDHAVRVPVTRALAEKYPFLANRYDVTVARAQEDMNIHILIEAYKEIPGRNLVVVSNWEISEYGKKLKAENKDRYSNIFLQDAVYDLNAINAIRSSADVYIHSHSLCGTAPSLTEAMCLGLPVICFDVDTNRATTEDKSYYFGDAPSLSRILSGLDERSTRQLAEHMHEIAERRYTWNRIANLYKQCIDRVT